LINPSILAHANLYSSYDPLTGSFHVGSPMRRRKRHRERASSRARILGLSGNDHLVPALTEMGAEQSGFGPAMATKKKIQKQSAEWRFAMEQIGRELRKVYRRPERLSRRLRAVVSRLERKPK